MDDERGFLISGVDALSNVYYNYPQNDSFQILLNFIVGVNVLPNFIASTWSYIAVIALLDK